LPPPYTPNEIPRSYSSTNYYTQVIQPYYAYGTTQVLGVQPNGSYSALVQPDVPRNLIVTLTKGTGNGAGTVTITINDQFGVPTTDTYTWTAGAGGTIVLNKVARDIGTLGIVISGLSGSDTISVGFGNKLGYDHKIIAGATKYVSKSGVGRYTNYTEDAVYHAVTMNDNIASGDIYQINSIVGLA
jgi:hypothetical protein